MKQLYTFDAFYNGRTATVEAAGERDAITKAIEIFKPAKHRQPAVHVERRDIVESKTTLSGYGVAVEKLDGIMEAA